MNLLQQEFQTRCPSSHPTVSVKSLKAYVLAIRQRY